MDKIFGEFVDVIEWTDSSPDTLVWRFERYGNEIKHGAKLTVREGQMAVFVNEGEVADIFQPGMYELLTANLPLLSTLQNWHHGFQSPFKAEVYFFNMRRYTDLKWGTKN
ncbi:MAG: SPFH domain-containing protein, partial [Geminicoccaceae bacterium]|nr:SPFH domain-containing protein [Geminicoccaceae bacterium]